MLQFRRHDTLSMSNLLKQPSKGTLIVSKQVSFDLLDLSRHFDDLLQIPKELRELFFQLFAELADLLLDCLGSRVVLLPFYMLLH